MIFRAFAPHIRLVVLGRASFHRSVLLREQVSNAWVVSFPPSASAISLAWQLRPGRQRARQLLGHLVIRQLRRPGTRNHHHVRCWCARAATSEYLTYQPPHPVAFGCVAHFLARGNAEARRRVLLSTCDHDEVRNCLPLSPTLHGKELAALAQAERPGKPLRAPPRCRLTTGYLGCFAGMTTVSRLRPLARRLFRTWRPPGLLMRVRNPCVLFLRLLLG